MCRVSERPDCDSCKRAVEQGFELMETGEAVAWADTIMLLAPDTTQPEIYETQIKPNLDSSKTLMFAHGFNIRYGTIKPPPEVDVSMIAPKAPGHRVRELYVEGSRNASPAGGSPESIRDGERKCDCLCLGNRGDPCRGGGDNFQRGNRDRPFW